MATPVTTMSILHARADALLSLGLTKHRAFRVLRGEFPAVERDMLLKAMPLRGAPKGVTPLWADRNPLHPVTIRTWGRKKAQALR